MSLCVIWLLVRCALYIVGYANHIQNGSHDCCGVCQSSMFEGETCQSGQSCLEQPERGMKRLASNWLIRSPIEGTQHPQASYLSSDQEVSFTPLRVGWRRVIRVFPTRDYPEKMLETTRFIFDGGRGALAPVWFYGEVLILAGSHLWMVTQAPLRSWLGTTVLNIRPLAHSRAQGSHQLASPCSSAPPGCWNIWGRGRCVCRTTFWQLRQNCGASLSCQRITK
jgi:hypothetical protein